MAASPAVEWEWSWSGILSSVFRALTSSSVAYGVSRPAMSLMTIESQPIFSSCLAWFTKVSIVWTGLVV